MTKEKAIEVIAERDGALDRWVLIKRGLYYRPNAKGYTNIVSEAWILTESEAEKHTYPHDEPVTKHRIPPPNYLQSRDALAPVLAKLSPEEKHCFANRIFDLFNETTGPDEHNYEYWLLNLPPETLAIAIAQAIEESRK